MADKLIDPRLIERAALDPELEERPEFLGGAYNPVAWKPKSAEHEYLRTMAPQVGATAAAFTPPLLARRGGTRSARRRTPVGVTRGRRGEPGHRGRGRCTVLLLR